jgi:hypothetical protein
VAAAAAFSIGDVTKGVVGAATFLLAFAPGFVAMKTYDWFAESEPRKVQDLLYEIVGYSSVNYAIASPVLALGMAWFLRSSEKTQQYELLAAASILCILVLPFALGLAVATLQKRAEKQNSTFIASIKTPWDYAFRNRQKSLVTVLLANGVQVTGVPGTASNYPYEHELFLSQLWRTDAEGNALEPFEESRGMLIFGSEIKSVLFTARPSQGS